MDDKENNIENFTREYLRRIDHKVDSMSSDISVLNPHSPNGVAWS
jgi:hypothetical protein